MFQAAFSDYCGYLITTVESLKDLNTHLEREVMMDRFRPSIVIQDSPPYDEVRMSCGFPVTKKTMTIWIRINCCAYEWID